MVTLLHVHAPGFKTMHAGMYAPLRLHMLLITYLPCWLGVPLSCRWPHYPDVMAGSQQPRLLLA